MDLNCDDDVNEDGATSRPFVDQPAYGRGLWRLPIKFVPASSPHSLSDTLPPPKDSIAEKYLAIVFPNGRPELESDSLPLCNICYVRFKGDYQAHVLSPVHQSALPRPPAPSSIDRTMISIDRTRMGFRYLERYGWDVYSGKGLGVDGQGMLRPFVPKAKNDTYGLGMQVKKEVVEKKVVKLDAGKVRKMVEEEKKRDERLHRMFYADEKVDKSARGLR